MKTIDGVQHLLLQNEWRVAQLQCVGKEIGLSPFALEIAFDIFTDVERQLRLVRRVADIRRNRKPREQQPGWTVEAMRHRDALAALDRRLLKQSYRQIAIFLYGEKAVLHDWNNPNQTMKNRVIRSVKRGQRMMNGGYKSLLA